MAALHCTVPHLTLLPSYRHYIHLTNQYSTNCQLLMLTNPKNLTTKNGQNFRFLKSCQIYLLTVSDIVVVIVTGLMTVSVQRCSDIPFSIIKHSKASLESFENLNKKEETFLLDIRQTYYTYCNTVLLYINFMWMLTLQRRPQLLEDGSRGSSWSPPKMSSRLTSGEEGKPPAAPPNLGKLLKPGNRPNPGNPANTSPKEVGLTTMTTGLLPWSASPAPESKGGMSSTSELSASSGGSHISLYQI